MSQILKSTNSSAIYSYAISKDKCLLAIQFQANNIVYVYTVNPAVCERFLNAKSKGGYVVQNIKGKFKNESLKLEEFEATYSHLFNTIPNLAAAVEYLPHMDFRL